MSLKINNSETGTFEINLSNEKNAGTAKQSNKPDIFTERKNQIKMLPVYTKHVTKEDVNNAMNLLSDKEAVEFLLAKSPLGVKKPRREELGAVAMMTDENGGGYYSSGVRTCTLEGEEISGQKGAERMQYRTDCYEQDMIYDKNGDPIKGSIIIRDNFGFPIAKYDLEFNDGKMNITSNIDRKF